MTATAETRPPITEPRTGEDPRVTPRRVLRVGLIAGGVMSYIAVIGMLETFDSRLIIQPILSLGYLALFGVVAVAGASFSKREKIEGVEAEPHSASDLLGAALAGLLAGAVAATFAMLTATFPDLRSTFPRMSPRVVDLLSFGTGAGSAFIVLPLVSSAVATTAAAVGWLPDRWRRGVVAGFLSVVVVAMFQPLVDDLFDLIPAIPGFLYTTSRALTITSAVVVFVLGAGTWMYSQQREGGILRRRLGPSADDSTRRRTTVALTIVVVLAMVVLPQLLGGIMNELLTNVGLFALMALGLNVVLGFAGLLDLGYVAFFAVGAYTTGVLTSPLSPTWNPELSWWMAFPVVLVMATLAGIFVGTPVLRMRGDYLAIVTLGFGEIVRLVLLSDWLSPYFGGAQGVRNIPGIPVAETEVNATQPNLMIYAVLAFILIAAFVSWRIEDSRVGRAWAALREDEDVAEAVGVDTVKAKLLAFVTGAVLASFAGALFAAKVGSVFTNSFQILVSIVILVIVIVGGMGSLPGVIVGALVLIGVLGGPNQPGLLQEFGEYKLLLYGGLLVYMMLKRPEGLLPSKRRQRELHQEEFLQDAWLNRGPQDGTPSVAEPERENE